MAIFGMTFILQASPFDWLDAGYILIGDYLLINSNSIFAPSSNPSVSAAARCRARRYNRFK